MKKMFLALVALMSSLSAFSADIIITTKSEKLEVKIVEVSSSEVRYKKMNNLKGPTFVINTSDINTILYEGGDVQVIEHAAPAPAPQAAAPAPQPAYAQPAYGQPAYGQPAYGQPAYGQPAYGNPALQAAQAAPGAIVRVGNTYQMNGRNYTAQEMLQFFYTNCPAAYTFYRSAKKQRNAGIALTTVGVALMIGVGVPLYVESYGTERWYSGYGYYTVSSVDEGMWAGGVAMMAIGGGCIGAGVPLLAWGCVRMNNAHQIYNVSCNSHASARPTLNLQSSKNGIGLALNF